MNKGFKKIIATVLVAMICFGIALIPASATWNSWNTFHANNMLGESRTWNWTPATSANMNAIEVFGITGRARATARNSDGEIRSTANRPGLFAFAQAARTVTGNETLRDLLQ